MFRTFINLILSMLTVGKHLFKRPVTLEYPENKKIPPKNFRGKPDVNGCIKCKTCIKVCPSGAIEIGDNSFKINLKKCIFCGNCQYYCPVKAIKMTGAYELSSDKVSRLELNYEIENSKGGVE